MKSPLKIISYILAIEALCLCGCSNTGEKSKIDNEDLKYEIEKATEETKVYNTIIEELYIKPFDTLYFKEDGEYKQYIIPNKKALIFAKTRRNSIDSTRVNSENLGSGFGFTHLSKDILVDFKDKNKTISAIKPFRESNRIVLYSSSCNIQSNSYPDYSHVSFSRPGFNKEKTVALIIVNEYEHDLSSAEYYIVLKLEKNKWVIANKVMMMIS